MGLTNWMGKNLAGVSGYGSTMGREAVNNGFALARVLYLGHGKRSAAPEACLFDSSNEMKAAGFTPYCTDPTNKPSLEDATDLSKHITVVGVTFAATCAFTGAYNYMQRENASSFTHSLGGSVRAELDRLNSGITAELLNHYNNLPRPADMTQVLNLEQPGTNDLLTVLLKEAVTQVGSGAVAFQRRGVSGFDVIAVPLAEETVTKIRAATQQFGW